MGPPPRHSEAVACLVMNGAEVAWLMAPDVPDERLTLEDFLRRPEWHQQAACSGQGVRTWFTGASETVERARAICGGCAVSAECVRYAMEDPDLEGVWAGLTAKERREIRRRAA